MGSRIFLDSSKFHHHNRIASFTSFLATPSTYNFGSTCVWYNSLSETIYKFNFLVYFEDLLDATMWLTLPKGLEGKVLKKQV
jgi:hypothetical protein